MNKKSQSLFLVISFLFWFSHFIYIPMLSPYIKWMGGTYVFTGAVLASYGLMQLVFRLPIGILSHLIKKQKIFVVAGMAVSTISCLTFALTESLDWVLVSRSLAGVAAATWVVFTVLFSSYAADDKLHNAMGKLSFSVVFAQLLGMVLSTWIVETWGWRSPYWLGAIFGSIGLLLSFFLSESKSQPDVKPPGLRDTISVLKEPTLLKVSCLSVIAHSIMFTTIFGFTTAYALSVGIASFEVGLIVFAFMVPHILSTMMSGSVFMPLFGKWRIIQFSFLLTALSTLLMPFAETKEMIMLFQAVMGFMLGLIFPLFLGMAIENVEREKRTIAMGAYQAFYALGMVAGPWAAGFLNSLFGLAFSFYFSALLGGAGFLFSLIWKNRRKSAIY